MSVDKRLDSIGQQSEVSRGAERPSWWNSWGVRALRQKVAHGALGATFLTASLGGVTEAEARDITDEELAEVAGEMSLSVLEGPVVSDLRDSDDLSTQPHPDGSGRTVFSHDWPSDGVQLVYRESPNGPDFPYPPNHGVFRAPIGTTEVTSSGAGAYLRIKVDDSFREAIPSFYGENVHQVEIGGVQYMIYLNNAGSLVKIPVSVIESWRPEDGLIWGPEDGEEPVGAIEVITENVGATAVRETYLVVLENGMVLAQTSGIPIKLINLNTGEYVNLSPLIFRPLFVDGDSMSSIDIHNALGNLVFHNDPGTPNGIQVENPAEGTWTHVQLDYRLEEELTPYNAVLTIDGTHEGADALPAGTQVRVEGLDGCDVDITELSTGADFAIEISELTGPCTLRVTITPQEGVEIDGPTEFVVEFTPEATSKTVSFETNNILVSKRVTVTAHDELVTTVEQASGSAVETTRGPEDRLVSGTFELYVPATDSTYEINVVNGEGSLDINVPEGESVEVILTDPISGSELGRFNLNAEDSALAIPVVYLKTLEPNATISVNTGDLIGDIGRDSIVLRVTTDGDIVSERIFGAEDWEEAGVVNFEGLFAGDPATLETKTYTLEVITDDTAHVGFVTSEDGQTIFSREIIINGITFPVQLNPIAPNNIEGEAEIIGKRNIQIQATTNGEPEADARIYRDGEFIDYTDSFGVFTHIEDLVNELGEEDTDRSIEIRVVRTDSSDLTIPRDERAEIGTPQIFVVPLAEESGLLTVEFPPIQPSDGENEEVGPVPDTGQPGVDTDTGPEPDTAHPEEDTNLPDANRPDASVDVADAGGSDASQDVEGSESDTDFEPHPKQRGGCAAAPGGYPALPVGFALVALAMFQIRRRRADGTLSRVIESAYKIYDGIAGKDRFAAKVGDGRFEFVDGEPISESMN